VQEVKWIKNERNKVRNNLVISERIPLQVVLEFLAGLARDNFFLIACSRE